MSCAMRCVLSTMVFCTIAMAATSGWASPPQDSNPDSPWYRASYTGSWVLDLYAGTEFEPSYPGSKRYVLEPRLDLARLLYKDPWSNRWTLTPGGVQGALDLTEHVVWRMSFEYEGGRSPDDDPAVAKLNTIRDTAEAGTGLLLRWHDLSAGLLVQQDVLLRGKGFVGFFAAGWDKTLIHDRVRLGAVWDISFADARYMRTEFGITEDEAIRSGYARYQPSAGLKSTTASLECEVFLVEGLSLSAEGEAEVYFDLAANSPLIQEEGSRTTYELGASLRYSFD